MKKTLLPKVMIVVGALVVLFVNALLTYFAAPLVPAYIDGEEIVLLIACTLLTSVYSYLLGRFLTQPQIKIKLLLWLLGILGSKFVALWLLGTPRTLPIKNATALVIWLLSSAFIFAWCLLGRFVKKYRHGYVKAASAERTSDENER